MGTAERMIWQSLSFKLSEGLIDMNWPLAQWLNGSYRQRQVSTHKMQQELSKFSEGKYQRRSRKKMPAKSQRQRAWAFANKGPAWARAHHFDNKGKLPKTAKKRGKKK
jgi:hypothetical protein